MQMTKPVTTLLITSTLVSLWYNADGASTEVNVKDGGSLILSLPGFKECGQFTLLDPYIRPVVVIEGVDSLSVIGQYIDRVVMGQTAYGFNLTILNATKSDGGHYKIAASTTKMSGCKDKTYLVSVKESLSEYLQAWSTWTECLTDCDPNTRRTRERNCSIEGGCQKIGDTVEIQMCNRAPHCARWTDWSSWGACSAKCGKGFKIRKRACLSGDSSLLRRSECKGMSTQSHMCMTVCEVIGDWGDWSEWSNCSSLCNGGTRNRTRECDPRFPSTNCSGIASLEENCNLKSCPVVDIKTVIKDIVDAITTPPSNDTEPLDIVVVVVLGCVFVALVIIILSLVIRRRMMTKRRRNAVPSRQDTPPIPKPAKKISKTSKSSDKRLSQPKESGNVYSELSSNFCYDSSEFDPVSNADIDITATTSTADNARNETIIDELENRDTDSNDSIDVDSDSEFDDDFDASGNDGNVESTNVVINNDTVAEEMVSSGVAGVYSETPDTKNETDTNINDSGHEMKTDKESEALYRSESIYYEPPEEDSPSKKEKTCNSNEEGNLESSLNYDETSIEIDPYADNVYENCEMVGGRIEEVDTKKTEVTEQTYGEQHKGKQEKVYEKTLETTHCNFPNDGTKENQKDNTIKYSKVNKSIPKNDKSIEKKLSNSLKEPSLKTDIPVKTDHTYVNQNVSKDTEYFYVTPKEIGFQRPHIYDTPKVYDTSKI